MHLPRLAVLTTGPDTEHTAGVSEPNETGSPDDADAETVNLTPTTCGASGPNWMTCDLSPGTARSVVAGTSLDRAPSPALLNAVTSK